MAILRIRDDQGSIQEIPCLRGPAGKDGEKGEQGPKGDKGDTGAPGTNGSNGKDGYSPVRGTDYWTEADKAEIKSYVDQAILNGAW